MVSRRIGGLVLACFWSTKGGSGTSVITAALAKLVAERNAVGSLLVDTTGDAEHLLAMPPDCQSSGLTDWLAAGASAPADGLRRIESQVAGRFSLLSRGTSNTLYDGRWSVACQLFELDERMVLVDAGLVNRNDPDASNRLALNSSGGSYLVIRPCYLALRRAAEMAVATTGVIVVAEPGRALRSHDIESVVGAPVVAEVAFDPEISRCVDAGLLAQRLPRSLARSLRPLAHRLAATTALAGFAVDHV